MDSESPFRSEFLEKFDTSGVELIEQTGYNVLLKAQNKLDGGLFALKIIPITSDREADYERAVREVRSLRELEHPNILRYYFSWFENPPPDFVGYPGPLHKWVELSPSCLFIQTEFCSEGTLRTWLMKKGFQTTVMLKMSLFRNIVDGLCYIHKMGKVHRDLKPDNVFLKFDWEGKLIARIGDFGLSRDLEAAGPRPRRMTRGGTELYSSPEQLVGTSYTEKTDIFPLGIILYELLSRHCELEESTWGMLEVDSLRDAKFPEEFTHVFPAEAKLIRSMLQGEEDADLRPSAKDIALWMDEYNYHLEDSVRLRSPVGWNSRIRHSSGRSPRDRPPTPTHFGFYLDTEFGNTPSPRG